jgi:hypothetical protein
MSLSFDIMPPGLNEFLELAGEEFSGLFSKHFSCSSLNFFITRNMNSFERFLDSCKQPEARRCQIGL